MIFSAAQIVKTSSRPAPGRRGGSTVAVISALAAVVLAVGGGALWFVRGEDRDSIDALIHTVDHGEFVLEVAEQGELVSAKNVDIRCEVEARGGRNGVKILQIVSEGTRVKKGDFLIRLDSAELEQELIKQQIQITTKQASLAEAKNKYDVAVIALVEYEEGTFVQERKGIENEILKAEEKSKRAKEYLKYSKKAHGKGIISILELEADNFAVKTATKELEIARNKMMVLIDYTKKKQLMDLNTTIKTTEAKQHAAEAELRLEKQKLADVEGQIGKCIITAPAPGVVKYANDEGFRRSRDENVIEEGSEVYQRQLLIQLPDALRMQVRLKVNESVIESIKTGMPAKIKIVGLRNADLSGSVVRASQYSERGGWRSGGVKEFVVEVSIDNPTAQLRTGLSAQVTIECQRLPGVLQIPVQGLYAHGDEHFCIVNPRRPELRKVKPGITNDRFVVIQEGLQSGEIISLNPRRHFDQVELPKLVDENDTADTSRNHRQDRPQPGEQPKQNKTNRKERPTRGEPNQGVRPRRANEPQAGATPGATETSPPSESSQQPADTAVETAPSKTSPADTTVPAATEAGE